MTDRHPNFFVGMLKGLSTKIPALELIYRAQDESANVGFDFPDVETVFQKVNEEYREMDEAFQERLADPEHFREELGDCFFALVNLCRHSGIDPEELARENGLKYLARCEYIEEVLRRDSKDWSDLTPQEITALWKQAKASGL